MFLYSCNIYLLLMQCRVLKSAQSPVLLTVKLKCAEHGRSSGNNDVLKASITSKTKRLLFKIDDDLRQDYIVMQIFRSLNESFMKEGLDLNLVFYDIFPTSSKEGKPYQTTSIAL